MEALCVFCFLLFVDSRGQWWAAHEHPSAGGDHRGERGTDLSALGPAASLQQPLHQQPLQSGSGPHDCRHSPHGCCPDGHTASLGPQWQGCPGVPCQQSRWVLETGLPPAPSKREGEAPWVSQHLWSEEGWGGRAQLRNRMPTLSSLRCPEHGILGTWLPVAELPAVPSGDTNPHLAAVSACGNIDGDSEKAPGAILVSDLTRLREPMVKAG